MHSAQWHQHGVCIVTGMGCRNGIEEHIWIFVCMKMLQDSVPPPAKLVLSVHPYLLYLLCRVQSIFPIHFNRPNVMQVFGVLNMLRFCLRFHLHVCALAVRIHNYLYTCIVYYIRWYINIIYIYGTNYAAVYRYGLLYRSTCSCHRRLTLFTLGGVGGGGG